MRVGLDTGPPDGEGELPEGWRWARLGELLRLRKEVVHPKDNPVGHGTFVGLEHVESGTGIRNGSVALDLGRLTGRKPRFRKGDIVYGYLRPYLNKVWLAEFDGICSVDQYVYEARSGIADAAFVAWYMRSPYYLRRAPIHTTPGQLPRIRTEEVARVTIPLPPLSEQRHIVARLVDQMAAVGQARAAVEAQLMLSEQLVQALLRVSLADAPTQRLVLAECLEEVTRGVGAGWKNYRVIGATRGGIAPAKAGVGKDPGRYKLADGGAIFYNPMRILIGSIAMVDDGDPPGITSPDYVVFKSRPGVLHAVWFYHWLRSEAGAAFIKTRARGAVRERMLFRRLASASVDLPQWNVQCATVAMLRAIRRLRHAGNDQLAGIHALPSVLLRRAFGRGL